MVASQNKGFLNIVRVLLLGAPLMLAACHTDMGPYPMPTGYKYHGQTYKSPPGPEPVWKRIEHMNDPAPAPKKEKCGECMDAASHSAAAPMMMDPGAPVGGSYSMAAHDLITRLVDGFGQPVDPVYLHPAQSSGSVEMNLERALRDAMMQRGFNLAPRAGAGPFTLHYAVSGLNVGDAGRQMVTVTLMGPEGTLAEESGIYALDGAAAMPAPYVEVAPDMSGGPMPITPAP